MKKTRILILIAGLFVFFSCSRLPENYMESMDHLPIFPDITDIKVPNNIAPLNFRFNHSPEKVVAVFKGTDNSIKITGKDKILIPLKKWRKLLKSNSGKNLEITIFTKQNDQWIKYQPFKIEISNTPIDPYIVYRLIAPGYESWSEMGIYQRNITNFDEDPIIDNRMLTGNCMNCHSFNHNNPDEMLFHLRGKIGATILVRENQVLKLNTKTEKTISNCVYPYWHPSGDFIAFSTNIIYQYFHSEPSRRIEVSDSESDLVIYDLKSNKLITNSLISSKASFETFPTFSADGQSLIFCSASSSSMPADYNKIKYNLCRISFDALSGTFGNQVDTLVSSNQTGKSVSFPRVSQDGKWLMFTLSDYGNFSIWHKEADLYILNMIDGTIKAVTSANSDDTESYHSWSSGSNWFIFSSRRIDGLYTRPYIAWLNENGEASKPFLLPQKDPEFYDFSLRSFNVPEFVTGKVKANGRNMYKTIKSDAENVGFELKN